MTHRVWQSHLNYRDTTTIIRAANGPRGLHHVDVFWSAESHGDRVIALKYRLVRGGNSSPWIKKKRKKMEVSQTLTHNAGKGVRDYTVICNCPKWHVMCGFAVFHSLDWLCSNPLRERKWLDKRYSAVLNDNACYHDKQYQPNPDLMAVVEWYRAFSWLVNEAIIRGEVLQRSLYYQRHEKSLSFRLLISYSRLHPDPVANRSRIRPHEWGDLTHTHTHQC